MASCRVVEIGLFFTQFYLESAKLKDLLVDVFMLGCVKSVAIIKGSSKMKKAKILSRYMGNFIFIHLTQDSHYPFICCAGEGRFCHCISGEDSLSALSSLYLSWLVWTRILHSSFRKNIPLQYKQYSYFLRVEPVFLNALSFTFNVPSSLTLLLWLKFFKQLFPFFLKLRAFAIPMSSLAWTLNCLDILD